jgi:transglutaminase-like putative cysteine protease
MAGMHRRTFLAAGALMPLLRAGAGAAAHGWRTFAVETVVELPQVPGGAMAWVPLPLAGTTPYQRLLDVAIEAPGATSRTLPVAAGATVVMATWPSRPQGRTLRVTARVATRDHAVDPAGTSTRVPDADLARYLAPTRLIPTDGIVRERAVEITRGHRSPLDRARAIYDWIVANTVRDPAVRGCGTGDIRWMLESGDLKGKCADLNALFVGLARSVGLPARDLYGVRLAPSATNASLGRGGGDVTTAQHCRAEVYVAPAGWIPVDPADVRKVILEDRPGRGLDDPVVAAARQRLFGSWEMNWIAYNDAHDVTLPGARGPALPFLMYPQAELDGVRRDSLEPATFRYRITARELSPG